MNLVDCFSLFLINEFKERILMDKTRVTASLLGIFAGVGGGCFMVLGRCFRVA